jgi:hypothetical protein
MLRATSTPEGIGEGQKNRNARREAKRLLFHLGQGRSKFPAPKDQKFLRRFFQKAAA